MFNCLKGDYELLSPVSGKVMDLGEVQDEVFAKKLAGDGVAIEPIEDIIVSPGDGILTLIFNTNHAFGMTLSNGIEVLVHIGIDTVELNGQGFERLAKEGDKVKVGDPIIKINNKFIEQKGYLLTTVVLITNMDEVKEIKYNTDINSEAGKDMIISYKTI